MRLPSLTQNAACAALALLALATGSCADDFRTTGKKLVVIGIDGMDPNLLRQYMAKGEMPNFQALVDEGTFVPLATSNPPQSPVAWSNFITGMDPGGHGVYDFLHRDPKTYGPVSSTTTITGEPWSFPLPGCTKIEIPASSEAVRKGVTFWDVLADHGVRAEIYRIPAAYPIQESTQLTLSDMGTPDLQGGIDGMYAWYTTDFPDNFDQVKAGLWRQVKLRDGRTTDAKLYSAPSPHKRPCKDAKGVEQPVPMAETPFTVHVDPKEQVVHIEIDGGDSCVLEQGKWSDWLRCTFDLGLFMSTSGMVKFYLQQAHPELRLYCSPVNIDPREPCMPISTPNDEAVEEMCEAIGPFYTAGLAEETKGLEEGTLSDAEFISQCDDVTGERMRMLDYALDRFDDGLLFFYFSSIDLRCHMMWRHIEEGHPARDPALAAEFAGTIEDAYQQMDHALGVVRQRIGKDTPIIVLSDHGFSPFLSHVDLNLWLYEQGYLVPEADRKAKYAAEVAQYDAEMKQYEADRAAYVDAGKRGEKTGPEPTKPTRPSAKLTLADGGGLDRTKTRAYAVGFNSIYVNLKGREAGGIVEPAEREALLDEIRGKLAALTDPRRGGAQVVLHADKRDDVYHGDQLAHAPDLVVGYNRGYGAADEAALGELILSTRAEVLSDNKSRWSGNHLMAPEVVPGVFLTNRKLTPKDPGLVDLTATMIEFFGATKPAQMRGKSLF